MLLRYARTPQPSSKHFPIRAVRNQNLIRQQGGLIATLAAAKLFADNPQVMDSACQVFFNMADDHGAPSVAMQSRHLTVIITGILSLSLSLYRPSASSGIAATPRGHSDGRQRDEDALQVCAAVYFRANDDHHAGV